MTTPAVPRVAGKRGKKQPEPVALGYLHEYLTEPLPAPSYPVDVRAGIPDDGWGMLGNGPDPACAVAPDGVGDCGFAGRQHYKMAKAAAYSLTEAWETSDELVTEYLAYDNGQDEGVSIPAVLLSWFQAGKVKGFARLDPAGPAGIDAAMAAFRGVYCGGSMTGDVDQLFEQQLPWTVANGEQPDPDDGHCILKVYSDGAATDGWVTWGHYQESTVAWTAACMTEYWVVITTEDEAARVDMDRLTADIRALGGTVPPAAQPVPEPAPEPAPGPAHHLPLLQSLAQLAGSISGEARAEIGKVDRTLGQAVASLRARAATAGAELSAEVEALLVRAGLAHPSPGPASGSEPQPPSSPEPPSSSGPPAA